MLLEYEKKLFDAINSRKEQEVVSALNEIKKINALVDNCDFLKNNVKSISIEAKDDEGPAPLIEAAKSGYPNILKALINARADLNGTNHDNQTALMLATQKGLLSSVHILLDAGANRELKDNKQQKAAGYAHQNLDCHDVLTNSRFLLPAEMKLFKAVCLNDPNLLQDTINEIELIHAEFKKYPELIDDTLAPSINIKNRRAQTPLILAAILGHRECVELLLASKKIEINTKDCFGTTALMWAVVARQEAIVQLFINQEKTDLDARKILTQSVTDHFTALHFAAKKGFGKICDMLIAAGANYHLKGGYENANPAFFANQSGCGDVFRIAVQKREQLIQRVQPKSPGFLRSFFSSLGKKSGYALVPMSSESELTIIRKF